MRAAWALCLPLLLAACVRAPEDRLPSLKVDPARVEVAGLSAGAYMATQSHLAWPDIFSGAALVAGGPWGCAGGQLTTALGTCMKGTPAPDVDALVTQAREASAAGRLGPLDALARSRVYVLHGKDDTRVAANVSQAAATFYDTLRAKMPALASMQVTWDGDRDFGHNLPVAASGDDCRTSVAPYLGHCGFDAAGAIFKQLYGPAPMPAKAATGELRSFDQNRLRPDGRDAFLADTGYAYVPKACMDGAACGVLVVFHGCKQNVESVGEAFVREAGFNRWADAYHVAVLYPQTRASFAPLNPQACWDWWGYSGAHYDTREGVQQQWLLRALAALGVPQARVDLKQP
ncbi:poly (3-hydroxybutyrate) depolymerase (PhaZ) [Oleiagrimonas soli]|uniref:Poly (3-hydroxybutyrate) depolymerase (PhaZ) n=1 Tax=Oleiagrimonas soli TaxID=1543381 RepID=A0A099CUF7_9GAMM|nr:poly (3-hydroxybutyrate) depolymerase (PhaZ) [Oleiagrimonas soli]